MICSTRVLGVDALREAQTRIRRGEPVRPTEALRARARALLHGAPMAPARLTPGQLVLLAAGNLLLTPLLGYAVAWRHHSEGGPATRQALLVTLPISILLFAALVMWRVR